MIIKKEEKMTYVCSDIHGCIEPFERFLSTLKHDDTVYVIGDVINRGGGLGVLRTIMQSPNIHMLKGNHEFMLMEDLYDLQKLDDDREIEKYIRRSLTYGNIGQEQTLRDFIGLSKNEQKEVIDFIIGLPLYKRITVNGREFFMVHAKAPEDMEYLEYMAPEEVLFGGHDYYRDWGCTVIVGHRPTNSLNEDREYRIYRKGSSIDVDCGLGFGGRLGVLCLETMREMYF